MSDIAAFDQNDASTSSPDRRAGSKILAFAKDWGGFATLVVALLYTFPSDLISKALDWKNHSLVQARSAIGIISELNANRVLAIHQVQGDAQMTAAVTSSFNIRIYNVLIENEDDFKGALPRLSASEAYLLATNFFSSALIKDSIGFFEAAVTKAKGRDNSVYAAANRDLGWALFTRSQNQDIGQARTRYLDALRTIGDTKNYMDPAEYAADLFALSVWELVAGDWKCGTDGVSNAAAIEDKLSVLNVQATSSYQSVKNYWLSGAAQKVRSASQKANGCPYEVPELRLPQ